MTEPEIRMLLAQVSALDNRRVTDAMIALWYSLFRDYTYAEAKWAFEKHAKSSPEYLAPAHLTGIIHQQRAEYAMMNPSRGYAIDAWVDFQNEVEAISRTNASRYIGQRYAVDAIEAINPGQED